MKRLLTILLILCSTLTYGQSAKHRTVGTDTTCIDTMRVALYMVGDLFLPIKGHFPPQWDSARALAYSPWDSSVYVFTKYNWIKIGSGGGTDSALFQTVYGTDTMRYNIYEAISAIVSGAIDTTVYSTRAFRVKGDDSVAALALQRVKYSDTANMLLNYAIEAQMLGYLGLKVDYADSGNAYFSVYGVDTAKVALRTDIALRELLSNKVTSFASPDNTTYPTTAAVNSLVGSYKLKSDSVANDGYTRRDRTQHIADSVAGLIPSVTGYLPISDSITVYATQYGQDTTSANLYAWAWATFLTSFTETDPLSFHKVDSNTSGEAVTYSYYWSNLPSVAGYLQTSDTGTMLAPYVRKADSNFNGGYETYYHAAVTYQPIGTYITPSDTAAMLTPYVRKADSNFNSGYETYYHAATTYQPIGTYITPSDTASMLSPYLSEQHASVTYVAIVADTTISAAYTLTSRDYNRTIHCTNGSNIALTIPTGLGTTFECVVLAEGAGTVTPTTSSTTFYYQPTSTTKIKSQGGATIRSWAAANSYLIIGSLE